MKDHDGLTPTHARALQQPAVDRYDLRSLRVILCGAAPLGPGLEDLVRARLPGIIMKQGYGAAGGVRVLSP
jgi:4-coumarate--CoA ligase